MVSRIYNNLNLYRRRWFGASAAITLASLALTTNAIAFQHRMSHKLRATAVVELTTDPSGTVTTRIFPVTILANGSFHDASIYESRPRPLALGDGVVYEALKTGIPVGYATIINGSNTPQGWVALGKWQAAGQVQASSKPKPAASPAAPADERPILHREGDNSPQPSPTPVPDQPQSAPSDDRPVLHRSGDSNQQASPSPTPTQTTSQPATQPDAEPQAPEDPDRPVLRRRKPPTADETDAAPPTVPSKMPAPTPLPQSVTTRPLPASTAGSQTFVAVSDAQSSDTRSYEYNWKPEEKPQVEAKMRKLALAQLPGEKAQANEHAMTNVVVRSFDLDLSNDAVVVITAEVPGGYLAPGGKTESAGSGQKFVSRYVTVIARVDIDGNPQKLAASVTDSSRLDVAPRLELVDAVDVDGDGLAELLFREYDFDQKSFIVYGVGHGTVTKVFEGASEPIK